MAESTPTPLPSDTVESSYFQRTVCLFDWWLIKAENEFEGKRLAVAGLSSRKDEAMRVFVSAPIIKRFDVFSLETSDGIYIIVKGFINEKRTLENGFPPEVFHNFLFGFPPNWESFATDWFREELTTGIDSGNAVPENVSEVDPEILTDGVDKCIPTSSVTPDEALGEREKPFDEDECNVSKETGGVNVAHGSGGNRCSARLRKIKVSRQKKNVASGGPPKHPDKELRTTSGALENPDVEGLESPVTPVQSRSLEKVNTSSDLGSAAPENVSTVGPESLTAEKSITTSLVSPEEALGDHVKPFPEDEHNASKGTGGLNVAHGSGMNRSSARLHNIKGCQQKNLASGVPDGEGLDSLVTPIQSRSLGKVNTSSEQLIKKSTSKVSRTLLANTEGPSKKKRVTIETKLTGQRKMTKSASAVKNLQERYLSPLNKGVKDKISSATPESLSLRKSRSGRLLLPPLEFWRNQIPVYNADHEITEIQEGASLISPLKDSSPSLSRFKNHKRAA